MASLAADLIVLDTIGKLYAHGRGLSGPSPRLRAPLSGAGTAARGADGPGYASGKQ